MKRSLLSLAAMAVCGSALASVRSRDYDSLATGHELRATNLGGLEASLKATQAGGKVGMQPGDGRAIFVHDKVVLGAASGGGLGTPAAADTLDFYVPAGTKVNTLEFVYDDCDTGAAFVASIGYRAVSAAEGSLAASATYFQANIASFQAAGRVECTFKPITFEQDVYIQIVVGTAPAGIAGNPEIHMVAGCSAVGAK